MHLFLLIESEPAGTRQLNGENPNVAILMGTARTRQKNALKFFGSMSLYLFR